MTTPAPLRGVWAAALTPIDVRLRPDGAKAAIYYRDLLGSGCDGLNVLGTTGESMSFSAGQRIAFMEVLAGSGLPLDRVMIGTGAACLDDAAALLRRTFDCGFAAALFMPPFFFRDASDDGVLRFCDELFARAAPPGRRVLLYNFPRMSGVTFHPSLVARLVEAFPEAIAGLKDSSNDVSLQRELIARYPDFAVFPSSEADLPAAKAYGAAGCISGSVCLWPELAREVFAGSGDAELLARRRATLEAAPLIPAVRYLTGKARSDDSWERPMPPLTPLTPEQKSILAPLSPRLSS